jgi:hypothetical protein
MRVEVGAKNERPKQKLESKLPPSSAFFFSSLWFFYFLLLEKNKMPRESG